MPISFLVDEEGKLPVTREVSLPLSYVEGLAVDKDGHLVITDTPSSIIYAGGIPRSPEGYLVVSGSGGGGGGAGGGTLVTSTGTVFSIFVAVYAVAVVPAPVRSSFVEVNYV